MNLPQTKNTTSISRPIEPIDRGLSDAVMSIVNVVTIVDGQGFAPRLPSLELKRSIAVRLADVRRALAPLGRAVAEKERAGRAVAAMLGGWVNAKAADPAAKITAYVNVLSDFPCWVVEQVCEEVARGRVESLDAAYPPSAAQLHQLCDEALERLRKEQFDLLTTATVKKAEEQPTPEQNAKIRTQLMNLHDRLERGSDEESAAGLLVKREQNNAELAKQQQRVAAEYAAAGLKPPSPLALSLTAIRDMKSRGMITAQQPTDAYPEAETR